MPIARRAPPWDERQLLAPLRGVERVRDGARPDEDDLRDRCTRREIDLKLISIGSLERTRRRHLWARRELRATAGDRAEEVRWENTSSAFKLLTGPGAPPPVESTAPLGIKMGR